MIRSNGEHTFRIREGFVSSLSMKMPLTITTGAFDDLVVVLGQVRRVAHGAKRRGHPVDKEKRFLLFQLSKNIRCLPQRRSVKDSYPGFCSTDIFKRKSIVLSSFHFRTRGDRPGMYG